VDLQPAIVVNESKFLEAVHEETKTLTRGRVVGGRSPAFLFPVVLVGSSLSIAEVVRLGHQVAEGLRALNRRRQEMDTIPYSRILRYRAERDVSAQTDSDPKGPPESSPEESPQVKETSA